MHKNTTKHERVVSVVSPTYICDTTKRRFNNEQPILHNSLHRSTRHHDFVQFSQENIIDVAKLGKIY